MPEKTKASSYTSPPRSRLRSDEPQKQQLPTSSNTSAGYRDRPTDDGKHGDAGATQAENSGD